MFAINTRFLFLVFVVLADLGCQSSRNTNESESTQLRAYRLIDSNQEDSAIVLLSDKLAELSSFKSKKVLSESERQQVDELKVTLASAYAKKAGITIREMVQTYQIGKQFVNLKSAYENGLAQVKNSQDETIKQTVGLLIGQIKLLQSISAIPKVKAENLVYIEQAVKILNSTTHLSPGDSIYSAFIKLILARSYLESENIVGIVPKIEKISDQCVANYGEFRQYLIKTSGVLTSCLTDLSHALPDQASDFENMAKGINDVSLHMVALGYASSIVYGAQTQSLDDLYKILGATPQVVDCSKSQ